MNKIPKDKEQLFNFITSKFPGDWRLGENFFDLKLRNEKNLITHNMFFCFDKIGFLSGYRNGIFSRQNDWAYDLSLKEIEKFYKQNYKMKNFI